MTTTHPNISQLPLLSEQSIESAQVTLESISKAVSAAQSGKMPSSDQLASIVQKVLKSNLLQPGLGSRVAGKIGGGELVLTRSGSAEQEHVANSSMYTGKLSPKGEEVVASSRGVLEALTRLGLEKNNDDKVGSAALGLSSENQS